MILARGKRDNQTGIFANSYLRQCGIYDVEVAFENCLIRRTSLG